MSSGQKIRFRVNTNSLAKMAGLVSNTVALSANIYLIGTGFQNNRRIMKQENISNKLQSTADIASALAGLAKVISNQVGIYHVKSD